MNLELVHYSIQFMQGTCTPHDVTTTMFDQIHSVPRLENLVMTTLTW